MNAIVEVPAGYRIDAKGRLIPVDQVKAIDIERSDLVERLCAFMSVIVKASIKQFRSILPMFKL